MHEQQLWKLVAGKLTGEASATEMLILRKYLQANKDLSNCVDMMTIFWQTSISIDESVPELAFEKIMQRIEAV